MMLLWILLALVAGAGACFVALMIWLAFDWPRH